MDDGVDPLVEYSGIQDAPSVPGPRKPPDRSPGELRVLDFPQAFEQYVEEERRGEAGAMAFGWPTIDGQLGKPIRPGEVVVVGARTGVGKTWIAQHAVERKLTADPDAMAIDFTMEMSAYQMAERFAGRALDMSTRDLARNVTVGQITTGAVLDAAPYLHRLRFFESSTAIDTIPKVIDLVEQDTSTAVGILVIDYAQLLAWQGNQRALLTEQMTVNVRRLKDVTREHRVITIACAQLSRAGGSGYTEPSMESIRESGAAEEASDRILMAWRVLPEKDKDTGKIVPGSYHEIRVKLEKNRHGRSGGDPALIRYDEPSMKMREIDEYAPARQAQLLDAGDAADNIPLTPAPRRENPPEPPAPPDDDIPF